LRSTFETYQLKATAKLRLYKRVSDARRIEVDCCVNLYRHRFRLKYVCGLFCRKLQHSSIFTEPRTEDLLMNFFHPILLSVIWLILIYELQ